MAGLAKLNPFRVEDSNAIVPDAYGDDGSSVDNDDERSFIGEQLDDLGAGIINLEADIESKYNELKQKHPTVTGIAEAIVRGFADRAGDAAEVVNIAAQTDIKLILGEEQGTEFINKAREGKASAAKWLHENLSENQLKAINYIVSVGLAGKAVFTGFKEVFALGKTLKKPVDIDYKLPPVQHQATGDVYAEAMTPGGRHHGWAKQYLDKSSDELQK